jgi:hypothetical protein
MPELETARERYMAAHWAWKQAMDRRARDRDRSPEAKAALDAARVELKAANKAFKRAPREGRT